jgi:hypothetical protein
MMGDASGQLVDRHVFVLVHELRSVQCCLTRLEA